MASAHSSDSPADSSASRAEHNTHNQQRPSGYEQGDYPELTRADVPDGVEVAMIWAETSAGIIGDGKDMPWYLPEDLKHFKNATIGHPVIMGRTSWLALGEPYRPLPGRENFVVTRNASFSAPGGHVHSSIPDAIRAAAEFARTNMADGTGAEAGAVPGEDADTSTGVENAGAEPVTVWILGGGQVYAQCMPIADRVVITEIHMTAPERFQVYAPAMDTEDFKVDSTEWLTSEKGHPVDEEPNGLRYRFHTWTRH